jgi:hypothetical protein
MHSVIAVFPNREKARQAAKLLNLPEDRLSLIAPEPREQEDADIGRALGGVLGGSLGVAVGASAGAAVASMAIPGVGPIVATGTIAGLLLGAGGVAAGARAGKKLDEKNARDPAHDPLDPFHYHEALRRGRTILLALANTDEEASRIRELLARSGGQDLQSVREEWWSEIRQDEQKVYEGDFAHDEQEYQRGFEEALEPERRGETLEAEAQVSSAYRRGFERGQDYFRKLYHEGKPAAR